MDAEDPLIGLHWQLSSDAQDWGKPLDLPVQECGRDSTKRRGQGHSLRSKADTGFLKGGTRWLVK